MRVAAAVLHYQRWPGVRQTLDALLSQTRRPDHVLVIEHGSGDDSAERIRAAYPDVEVVAIQTNRGQIAGNNHALRASLAKAVDAVLLMCDDSLLAPDALERLVERMEQKQSLGAVGPLVAYPQDGRTMIHHGGYLDARTRTIKFMTEPGEVSEWVGREPRSVDWVEGGVILFRAQAARQTGFLDEALYYRFGELEYTLRMRALGWKLECVPSAVVYEDLGPPNVYLDTRNQLRILRRHAPFRYLIRDIARVGYRVGLDAIDPRRRADRDTWSRLRALVDFVAGRWGPPPKGATIDSAPNSEDDMRTGAASMGR
jgi:rhamnopyranosyl-N-acetylglucosaminyl-diphospho-decaprenol beta-1,3/1,4-galactofuranosyltransferase